MNDTNFAVGALSGIAANALWYAYPYHTAFALQEPIPKSALSFLEHHHFGMALIALQPYVKKYPSLLDGTGIVLIGSELFQPNPFGIGKSENEVKLNAIITSLLAVWILLTRFK